MKNNEDFHQLIKSKIDAFQPEYQDSDWKSMQKKIRFNKLIKLGIPTVLVGIGVIAGINIYADSPPPKIEISNLLTFETSPPKDSSTTTHILTENIPQKQKIESLPIQDEIQNNNDEQTQHTFKADIKEIKSKSINYEEDTHKRFVDKEIRILSASAISMSERISRVRELGKTFETTSQNVLDRNAHKWKNFVIVCDITSSMFPYTTQVFDWLRQNSDNSRVKGIVFFTDCDSLGNQAKKLPAKMFSVSNLDENKLWETMFAAIENTENNADSPENSLEALVYAQENFKDVQDIILIADNSSTVKDMNLLSKLKKNVHIIACNETYIKNLPFQPDLVKIAKKTKGTIHTSEDDISDLSKIEDGIIIRVGKIFFRYHRGNFFATKFKIRP